MQVADGTVAEVEFLRRSKVQEARLADHTGQVHGVVLRSALKLTVGVGRSNGGSFCPPGSPDGQVASGRMAQRHYFAELEVMVAGDVRTAGRCPARMSSKVCGPTTAVAGSPVLEVPGGDSVRCKVPRKGLARAQRHTVSASSRHGSQQRFHRPRWTRRDGFRWTVQV